MKKQEIDHILTRMLDSYSNVSDLNITVGRPLQVESAGELLPVDLKPPIKALTPFQTEIMALNLIDGDRRLTEALLRSGSCDLSYSLPGKARFRVNIFSQSGHLSIVLRQLESKVPTIRDMKLPPSFSRWPRNLTVSSFSPVPPGPVKPPPWPPFWRRSTNGAPFMSSPWKTPSNTSIPIKRRPSINVSWVRITIPLPMVCGRPCGRAPKVILVGEMRDRETVEIGLTAAETGHLVFTTLHTVDAGQTFNRVLGMFSNEEEKQVRIRLADTVRWVVSQRLLPKIGGGRVAAFEILRSNLRVKESILHGESEGKTFYEMMEAGRPFGMTTFDDYIVGLYENGLITEETALAYASHKAVAGRGIDRVKSARGESTTDIKDLEIDRQYGKRL